MSIFVDEPEQVNAQFIFAHGAGAGAESEFMISFAKELTKYGIRVIRFNFPYMTKMSEEGKRRPPDRMPKLEESYISVVKQFASGIATFIGGKSMGSRVAVHVADQCEVSGVICLGYPFHPQNKPEKLRLEALQSLKKSSLILQGERDKLGSLEDIQGYHIPSNCQIEFLPDGDHDLKPRKLSGFTHEAHIETAALKASEFILEGK